VLRSCLLRFSGVLDFDPRREDGGHRAAFETCGGFDRADVLYRADDGIDLALRRFGVGDLTTAEADGDFHLVAFFEEAANVLRLEIEIVVVGLGAKLDLFQRDLSLPLAGVGLSLLFFVLELAEVHDLADGRGGLRVHLDQVEVQVPGHPTGLVGVQDA